MNSHSSKIDRSSAPDTEASAKADSPAFNFPESTDPDAFDCGASSSPMLFPASFIGTQSAANSFDSWKPLDDRPGNPRPELKLVEFSVDRPAAATVQLAAEFTNWDEAPIDMIRFDDGVWSITVPLPAGAYAYRFFGGWGMV